MGIGCCLEYDALLGVVFISSVRPGGPAALSGKVAVGDVIVKVDGTPVDCLQDAADLLVGPAGSLVLLSLLWRSAKVRARATRPFARQQVQGRDTWIGTLRMGIEQMHPLSPQQGPIST